MLLPFSDIWFLFESRVFPVRSTPVAFNQYLDRHDELDLPDAPARRRENLRNYIETFQEVPEVLILAEAPGPWGCRFSGVPITSEAQLEDPAFPIPGTRTGTRGAPYQEYSARIFWRVMQPVFQHFFIWNSIPYHPHRDGLPLSIRTPGLREVALQTPLLQEMIDLLHPAAFVAVGKKAEHAFQLAGKKCTYVRHPSQGGSKIFENQMGAIFGL